MNSVIPLTNEEKELVAKNHNLIYFAMKRCNIKEPDEWYGIFAIGLCKAAQCFDETKGYKFSTYAIYYLYGYYKNTMRYMFQGKDKINQNALYYDKSIQYAEDDTVRMDSLQTNENNTDFQDESNTKMDFEFFCDKLEKETHKNVIHYLTQGFSVAETAKKLGISRQRVDVLRKEIQKRYKREFCANE